MATMVLSSHRDDPEFRHRVNLPRDLSRERLLEIQQWLTSPDRPGRFLTYGVQGNIHLGVTTWASHTVFGFSDENTAFEFKMRFV